MNKKEERGRKKGSMVGVRALSIAIFASVLLVASIVAEVAPEKLTAITSYVAVAERRPLPGSEATALSGTVRFEVIGDMVQVTADLTATSTSTSGLGAHAIHVHQYGDYDSVGDHYVGSGGPNHGCPGSNSSYHEGDMGSWTFTTVRGSKMRLTASQSFSLLQLSGQYSIVGRSVVVHQTADSCAGSAGDAGSKAAMGEIGLVNVAGNEANQQDSSIQFAVCR